MLAVEIRLELSISLKLIFSWRVLRPPVTLSDSKWVPLLGEVVPILEWT